MNELFSGIGAQIEGIKMTGLFDCDVICTSDISKEAIVSYAAIHCGLTNELINTYENYPTREEMAKMLSERNIGYDFKKNKPYNWNKLINKKSKDIEKYYLACVLSNNIGDISKVSKLDYADFWTYSFPCTDISVAGKQEGIKRGETRSGLLYEVERLLKVSIQINESPKYLLLENVKNLVGKQFKEQFDEWVCTLNDLGYNTYFKVVNAKNCGIPQNRERVFAVSIKKDIDTEKYEFMNDFDNGIRLKDLLENEVEEKYYLSKEIQNRFISKLEGENIVGRLPNGNNTNFSNDMVFGINNNIGTLKATDYKDPKKILCGIDKSYNNPELIENANCITAREDRGISNRKAEGTAVIETNRCIQTGDLNYYNFDTMNRVYSKDGISPTLQTLQGGNRQPKILEDFYSNRDVREYTDYSPTLRSERNGLKVVDNSSFKIRKLTPKECWRLMGFNDECFDKAKSLGMSDSAGYEQAGNSIVTYCIKGLMEHLYKAQYNNTYECFDENFYSATSGLNSVCGEYKPVLVGGVGEINFGKQFRQGNRIYDSNEIAMCLLSQPVGNAGGYSYLYLVEQNFIQPPID